MKPSWGKVRIGVLAALSAAAFAVISAATLTVSHAQLAASPWPMYHHDLRHTGLSTVDTSANQGTLKWKFATGASLDSSPAVGADGTIYIGSEDNNLYALNPNGRHRLKWKFAAPGASTYGGVYSSPAVGADGTIYVGAGVYVYALNPNGTQRHRMKWKFAIGYNEMASPVVGADGTIYVGSSDNNLYALNPNGILKWKFAEAGGLSCPAVGADGTIYVGGANNFFALNPNGTQKWKLASGGIGWSSPAVGADGTIYFSSRDDNVYAVGPLPLPFNCQVLVQSIENMRHHGPPGPRFTAAQWAQIQKELQQCVAEHQLTQSQADGAIAGYNSYTNNLPNSGPPLRGTPMQ